MTDQANAPEWEPTEEQQIAFLDASHALWDSRPAGLTTMERALIPARAAVFGPEIEALKARAEKAEADLAREQRLHNESRRLHADTIQKAQLLGHAHAKTAKRLHNLRTKYRVDLAFGVKAWRERAKKAEADRAELLADAKTVLAVFKPRFGGGPDAHAEHAACSNLESTIAKVEGWK